MAFLQKLPFGVYLLFGVLAALSVRLPVLLGSNLYLDSDEAVVGLMALDLARGVDWSLFFYGQDYGLTILESGLGALFFRVFGVSDVALRMAMLSLWLLGWVFFALAVRSRVASPWNRLVPLLLVFCPAWGLWSSIARGGYVSAFLLTNLGFWLLLKFERRLASQTRLALACGCVFALLFYAQALFALTLAPIVFVILGRFRRSARPRWLFVGISITVIAIVLLHADEAPPFWNPDLFADPDPLQAIRELPHRILVAFGGLFFFSSPARMGPLAWVGATAWLCLLLFAVARAVSAVVRRRPGFFDRAFLASLVLLFGFTALFDAEHQHFRQFRYLLPIPALLVFYLGARAGANTDPTAVSTAGPTVQANWRGASGLATSLLLLCCVAGGGALIEASSTTRFGGFELDSRKLRKDMLALVDELRDHDVKHVYTPYPLMHWDVMFYSGGAVSARGQTLADWLPAVPARVDRALRSGAKTALVGWRHEAAGPLPPSIARIPRVGDRLHLVGEMCYWFADPEPELLEAIDFELTRPK